LPNVADNACAILINVDEDHGYSVGNGCEENAHCGLWKLIIPIIKIYKRGKVKPFS
jgi:hypothetical protein